MPALRSSEKPKSILKKTKEVVSNGSASKGKGKETVKVESVKKDAKSPARGVKRGREEGSADKVHSEKQVKVSTKPKADKVSKKAAIVEEVPETTAVDEEEEVAGEKDKIDVQEDDDDSDDDSDDDEEVLHGLSDVSDADSSDEDDNIGEITKSGVVKLPSSRDDAAVKSRLDNVQKKKKESGRVSSLSFKDK
jgi:RNA polymerase primary sigma factor